MTDKNQIKQYLQDRLQGLEDVKKDREWTTAELGDVACCKQTLAFIDSLQEEPTSNDLEEAADKHLVEKGYLLTTKNGEHLAEVEAKGLFKAGAKWQKEQMEKNRIEHCDNITEEQYNLETGFLDDFLDKNKRMPTFLDAIEYGMQKAQKGE